MEWVTLGYKHIVLQDAYHPTYNVPKATRTVGPNPNPD